MSTAATARARPSTRSDVNGGDPSLASLGPCAPSTAAIVIQERRPCSHGRRDPGRRAVRRLSNRVLSSVQLQPPGHDSHLSRPSVPPWRGGTAARVGRAVGALVDAPAQRDLRVASSGPATPWAGVVSTPMRETRPCRIGLRCRWPANFRHWPRRPHPCLAVSQRRRRRRSGLRSRGHRLSGGALALGSTACAQVLYEHETLSRRVARDRSDRCAERLTNSCGLETLQRRAIRGWSWRCARRLRPLGQPLLARVSARLTRLGRWPMSRGASRHRRNWPQ